MRKLPWAALAWLVLAVPAQAQQQDELPRGFIEGGYSRLRGSVSFEGISVSASVNGFYFGGSGRVHDRVEIFGALNRFSGSNGMQFGSQFRLGPSRWVARPAVRAGIVYGDGDADVTGGFALRVGRQVGGIVSADYSYVEGVLITLIHVGGYVGFGGN